MTDLISILVEKEFLADRKSFLPKQFKHPKGQKQISEILQTTLDELASNGYSAITLSIISNKMGMSKGNLQYYFPTIDSLLRSAMLLQMEQVKKDWLAAYNRPAKGAWQRLENIVKWDISFSRSDAKKAVALEKRAYASRDEPARKVLTDWYDWVTDHYASVLAEIRPDLSPAELLSVGALVNSMLEGLAPYFGARRLRKKDLKLEVQNVMDGVSALIQNFPAAKTNSPSPRAKKKSKQLEKEGLK